MAAATEQQIGNEGRPLGPFMLITVNTSPDRAKRLVGRICDEVKSTYQIIHVDNITSIADVRPTVDKHRPDVLFTASMWSPEEAQRIVTTAKEVVPELRTLSVPQGLRVENGPDAVIEYVKGRLPEVLGSSRQEDS